MNCNEVGSTTLAYLRGEKDLYSERKRVAQLKNNLKDSALLFGMSEHHKRRMERLWKIASLLQEDSRMTITEISKTLKIPISTAFDDLEELKKAFLFTIVLRKEYDPPGAKSPFGFELEYQPTGDAEAGKGNQFTLGSE